MSTLKELLPRRNPRFEPLMTTARCAYMYGDDAIATRALYRAWLLANTTDEQMQVVAGAQALLCGNLDPADAQLLEAIAAQP